MKITNRNGTDIYWNAAVDLMDDEIRETLEDKYEKDGIESIPAAEVTTAERIL